MIVWQLGTEPLGKKPVIPDAGGAAPFTTHECLLTIDNITRISKPIVVLTGKEILARQDIVQIIEYGFALGLKIVVEVAPGELTDEILERFIHFGPKVFRVILDDAVEEDMDTRYRQSPQFATLEDAVRRLRKAGYEIHLGITVESPDLRQLAFQHDYALQKGANGLYCHLTFDATVLPGGEEGDRQIEELVNRIAQIKRLSPPEMYFSPQCIKYGLQEVDTVDHDAEGHEEHTVRMEWKHWCLAGKSFLFIGPTGVVQPCASLEFTCGSLRDQNYDFKKIWSTSETLQALRQETNSCTCVREMLTDAPHLTEDGAR
ncbi:MAG TPA: radical SAM protein [Bacteroidota bacterium]|nr:radical SAM protein [Bacteroidota bacterium]